MMRKSLMKPWSSALLRSVSCHGMTGNDRARHCFHRMGPNVPQLNGLGGLGTSRSFATVLKDTNLFVAVIMGKPGCGKGTISEWLEHDLGFSHLSSGDMLRNQLEMQTELGKKAENYMNAGALVPDDLMVHMVIDAMNGQIDQSVSRILLDGFPRTVPQALALEDRVSVDVVLDLEVSDEEIVERISDRWVHIHSGRVYSYKFHPPKVEGLDDITGEPLVRRDDDMPDKVRERLKAYDKSTAPVLEHYKSKNLLHVFDGNDHPDLVKEHRRSDAIYQSLKPFLEQYF